MALKPEQMQKALEVVKTLPLFAGCSDEQLQAIVIRLEIREWGAGKVAMMDQEINKTLYLLASGSVSVWKRVSGEKKMLATLQAPSFFGERSMFEESPAAALVKTEALSTTFTLERSKFNEVIAQFPAMADTLQKNMEAVRAQRMGPPTSQKE